MGRVIKVVSVDRAGAVEELASKQLPEDPYVGVSGYGQAIKVPPYSLEQLVFLAESHPVHSSALEQKVQDIVGGGPSWEAKVEGESDEEQLRRLQNWWDSLFETYTPLEVLQAVWLDYETLGWGIMEVARDSKGRVGRLYHVPGHTVRALADGKRFVQMRQGRLVYFKAWGVEEEYYASSGRLSSGPLPPDKRANELLIFKRPSRRSTYYGIPSYVSAIGWLALSLAARDYNIYFFENHREPRHMFVIEGLEEATSDFLESLEQALRVQHKEPHRNLIVALSGEAKVNVHSLGLQQNDMHFSRLIERVDDEILMAHRIPPDRLGFAKRGFLGGSVAASLNRIYKESVVTKGQAVLESRLNRFIEREFGEEPQWRMVFEEPDIRDETTDADIVVELLKVNVLTLNEARHRLGYPSRDEFGDLTLAEYLTKYGLEAKALFPAAHDGRSSRGLDEIIERLDEIEELLLSSDGHLSQ